VALPVERGSVTTALYWDTEDPYHYVRLTPSAVDNVDLLIVGGADHKVGQEGHYADRFEQLEAWARQRFPVSGECVYRWSGQVQEPADGLGYIGRNPADEENVFIITGDSGNGMTNGTLGGMIIADLIAGRENPWADLYRPSRPARSVSEFLKENINVARQYGNWLTPDARRKVELIPRGSGEIV